MSQLEHIPVMISELVSGLGIVPGGRYVDGTVGAAGHARAV
ncbi:MAG: 16S rRNA (cytosine(1402)-N(4))-methyltransferase, partial [Chloroflexi bacterium]|nr:16S rRNA (cytosine(1402)-N(4))-methyltransferase [Chloroflexota bacterium]